LSKILVIAAAGLIGARVVFSLANKLMGQVNVVRYGMKSVRPSGAMTLTTGLAAQYTSPGSDHHHRQRRRRGFRARSGGGAVEKLGAGFDAER
jgi:hypothetical protein